MKVGIFVIIVIVVFVVYKGYNTIATILCFIVAFAIPYILIFNIPFTFPSLNLPHFIWYRQILSKLSIYEIIYELCCKMS